MGFEGCKMIKCEPLTQEEVNKLACSPVTFAKMIGKYIEFKKRWGNLF